MLVATEETDNIVSESPKMTDSENAEASQKIDNTVSESSPPDADNSLRASTSLDSDNTSHEQGVEIGGGWLRYWDATESEHYYYHTCKCFHLAQNRTNERPI